VSLSIKERHLFCVGVLPDQTYLFAVLHADVDITFILHSFICVIDIKWICNSVQWVQETHFLTYF